MWRNSRPGWRDCCQAPHSWERSREYLAKAFEELEAGDLTQASEKGWGAAAQIVKAVADERGINHHHHAALFRTAQALSREVDDNDTEIQLVIIPILHGTWDGSIRHGPADTA